MRLFPLAESAERDDPECDEDRPVSFSFSLRSLFLNRLSSADDGASAFGTSASPEAMPTITASLSTAWGIGGDVTVGDDGGGEAGAMSRDDDVGDAGDEGGGGATVD